MSRRKIIEFLDEVYAINASLQESSMDSDAVRRQRVEELLTFVQNLPDAEFAIIAVQDD